MPKEAIPSSKCLLAQYKSSGRLFRSSLSQNVLIRSALFIRLTAERLNQTIPLQAALKQLDLIGAVTLLVLLQTALKAMRIYQTKVGREINKNVNTAYCNLHLVYYIIIFLLSRDFLEKNSINNYPYKN